MESNLSRLAANHGIEPGYHDVWGQWRATSEDTQRAMLAAIGIDAGTPEAVDQALQDYDHERWSRVVPPVTVIRRAQLERGMRIHLPESALSRALAWRLAREDSEVQEERFNPLQLAVLEDYDRDGLRARAFALPLPPELAEGYHRVSILEGGTMLGEGTIVVTPERCYLPPKIAEGGRVWGTTVQLYGLRSERNAGIGDFTDLKHCAEAWGERGAGIVGTNPLHAMSLRDPGTASPYSPSSRLFLNPVYLDIEAIEDFAELSQADAELTARWQAETRALRETELVDYARVCAAKLGMLEALYANFAKRHPPGSSARARHFAQFREQRGKALRYDMI